MLIPVETLRVLIDRAVAQQRVQDDYLTAWQTGDKEAAEFLLRPADQQQHLLTRQDYADAADAVHRGDEAGAASALYRAIMRPPVRRRQKVQR